ncbi:YoaK family protein [Streptomyces sp. WMMC500]|uniref:YoaK family protein n=1 Tax=Streptomyces sp. WMMC500 TaxID=3015154 RepID=UPI00248C5F4D|nr:YoaK family protein [Streptomyces sp. WMMC500]WBB58339.1 YoaK family protein [Streptomyces sp. WMMC500]
MTTAQTTQAAPRPAARADRGRAPYRTDAALILLTVTAGITDAISFLGLGGVFTANMTGNLVLVGMAATSQESWPEVLRGDVLRCTASFAGFALGMFAGFRLLRARPAGSVRVLGSGLALHAVFLAGWVAADADPGTAAGAGLIAASATAMGVQTAAARGLDRAGITTTFVTGTLTSLVSGLAQGDRRHAALRTAILTALLAGGLIGGVLLAYAPRAAALPPLVATAGAMALCVRRGRPGRGSAGAG